MKKICFLILLLFLLGSGNAAGKTLLHCVEISGKITDGMDKPVANVMVIFHPGEWNADTVYTDSEGHYSHIEALWLPCNGKAKKKFWKTMIDVKLEYASTEAVISFLPKVWLRVCEGRKTQKPQVMTADFHL
ncbi:MAG: hypothetical protein JNM00_13315 [Flavobacteriales bacterium]|nr:hypothetical protein [Flavobacteriales bacterium]